MYDLFVNPATCFSLPLPVQLPASNRPIPGAFSFLKPTDIESVKTMHVKEQEKVIVHIVIALSLTAVILGQVPQLSFAWFAWP